MRVDYTITDKSKPNFFKKRKMKELIEYALDEKILITYPFFIKHGFSMTEVNWINEHKGDDIKMKNRQIIEQTNKRIQELKEENKRLKKQLKNGGGKTTTELHVEQDVENDEMVLIKKKIEDSDVIKTIRHSVDKDNYIDLWKVIIMLTDEDDKKTCYREIVSALITKNGWDVDVNSFNGGKNRSKYMFPYYYYPLKMLQSRGYVDYNNGNVKRKVFKETLGVDE